MPNVPEGPWYRGAGCEHCLGKGYLGRAGLYELLMVDDRFRDAMDAMLDQVVLARAVRGASGEIEDFEVGFANAASLEASLSETSGLRDAIASA